MLLPSLYVLIGLVVLFFGGEGLVRGSSRLALKLGLTPLVVGLIVVAFGTSAPELVVSINAALDGRGDIAIGNVLGSNILNIGFIIGLTALIYPLKVDLQILRLDLPVMVGVSAIATLVLHNRFVSRLEGALLVAGLVFYIVFTVYLTRKIKPSPAVQEEFVESLPTPKGSIMADIGLIVIGLAMLVVGSQFLVEGAVSLARGFGVSEAIIGLTVVAVGTSMPELAAGLIAVLKKEPDIALGNVIGSNIFNILGIMGGAALIKPLAGAGIKMTDLAVMMGFALLLAPLLFTSRKIVRWEGALLLAGYAAYLALVWPN
ncbi:MAG TPA: calcium/sodium antiporter [Chthoniobacteraceae bacterium]|nr:calcium/sodium antiporter [Chthoniobacteraceae bacterium]